MRKCIIGIISALCIFLSSGQSGCFLENPEQKSNEIQVTNKQSEEIRADVLWENPSDMEVYIKEIMLEKSFQQLLDYLIGAESDEYRYDFYALPQNRYMQSGSKILMETEEIIKQLEQKTGRLNLARAKVNQEKSVILWSAGFPTTMATFYVYDPSSLMTIDEMASEVRHLMVFETESIQHKCLGQNTHLFFGNANELSNLSYEVVYENLLGKAKQYDDIPYVGQEFLSFQCYWLSKGGEYKRLTEKELGNESWTYIFCDGEQKLFIRCIDAGEGAQVNAFARYNLFGDLIEWQGGTKPLMHISM